MTTTLDVLNHMITVRGESPVSSPDSTYPTALSAQVTLKNVLKTFQEQGWWFNTELDLTLSPNSAGEIIIPDGTLKLDPVDTRSALVQRGKRLYDMRKHTYIFTDPINVNLTLLLKIEDLPEAAASYVMHKAGYDFYVNDDGDEDKADRLQQDVLRTFAYVQREHLAALNLSLDTNPAVARMRSARYTSGRSNPTNPGGR